MSIINDLSIFTPSSKGSFTDPTKHRRGVFINSLKKQIGLLNGEEIKGRKWWREQYGEVVSSLRYSTTCMDLGEGTHFSVSTLDELKDVYSDLIEEVSKGDLDGLLESHWNKSSFNPENRKVV